MPRRNPPREMFAEPHVAQRVAIEREARGWSYEGLAKRMTDVGCPMRASALYRIEKGDPPRRITVDELVAFARVFDVGTTELLIDPGLRADEEVARVLDDLWGLLRHRDELRAEIVMLNERIDITTEYLVNLTLDYPKAGEGLAKRAADLFPEGDPTFWQTYTATAERVRAKGAK